MTCLMNNKSTLLFFPLLRFAVINAMRRLRAWPSCTMPSLGASLAVAEFTEGIFLPFRFSWKDRSRMHRNAWLLWGIIATGETLSFFGILCLMSFHFTIRAYLFACFVRVSSLRACVALFAFVDAWLPLSSAASMCLWDQSGPQSTGQPLFAYLLSTGAESCWESPWPHQSDSLTCCFLDWCLRWEWVFLCKSLGYGNVLFFRWSSIQVLYERRCRHLKECRWFFDCRWVSNVSTEDHCLLEGLHQDFVFSLPLRDTYVFFL